MLYSLATRYCLHSLRVLDLGFHVSNPAAIVEGLHVWNHNDRPLSTFDYIRNPPDLEDGVGFRVLDLKTFFPSVPVQDFIEMLDEVQELLENHNPA